MHEGELTTERAKNESILSSKIKCAKLRRSFGQRQGKIEDKRQQSPRKEIMETREDNVGMKAKLRTLTDLSDQ